MQAEVTEQVENTRNFHRENENRSGLKSNISVRSITPIRPVSNPDRKGNR